MFQIQIVVAATPIIAIALSCNSNNTLSSLSSTSTQYTRQRHLNSFSLYLPLLHCMHRIFANHKDSDDAKGPRHSKSIRKRAENERPASPTATLLGAKERRLTRLISFVVLQCGWLRWSTYSSYLLVLV